MRAIPASEFEQDSARLLEEVETGSEDIVVMRGDKPIAWITNDPTRLKRAEAIRRIIEFNERIARENPASLEPFDLKAAIEEGRM